VSFSATSSTISIVKSGNAIREWTDPTPSPLGEVVLREFVKGVGVPLIHDLIDKTTNQLLVRLCAHCPSVVSVRKLE